MISIGNVWDRTTDVLSGRGAMLAGIAGLLILVPTLVSAAVEAGKNNRTDEKRSDEKARKTCQRDDKNEEYMEK